MSEAVTAIRDVLRDYLDGLYNCDVELLRQVFHPAALYATAAGGETLIMDIPTYLDVVARRDPPARTLEMRREHILLIDLIGPETAMVKLTCHLFRKDYVDLLSFIHVDGRWKIIAKVFHFTPASLC